MFFPQNYNNNNNKNALYHDIAWRGGYQKRMRGTWGVSVYVAVVRLDTILSNSNAATTKKDVQKESVVWPTIKQQKYQRNTRAR